MSGFRRRPFPAAGPLGGLLWPAGNVLWVWMCVCAVCVVPVRCVSWCVVLPFACPSGAPLSGASLRCCARLVLVVPPSLRTSLARLLAFTCLLRGFVALSPFLYPLPFHLLSVPFRGVGGLLFFICSLAVSTYLCWRPPPVLMAYRAREDGGFHVSCLVGGCADVALLCASFF